MDKEDVSLYETLGIDPAQVDVLTVGEKDLATAYRRAALRWHPDKNPGDEQAATRFSRVVHAYEVLSSDAKRKSYDDRIRQVRARRQSLQRLDENRAKLRLQLQQREQQAAAQKEAGAGSSGGAGHNSRKTTRDALFRVQNEIDRLRREKEAQSAAATGSSSSRHRRRNQSQPQPQPQPQPKPQPQASTTIPTPSHTRTNRPGTTDEKKRSTKIQRWDQQEKRPTEPMVIDVDGDGHDSHDDGDGDDEISIVNDEKRDRKAFTNTNRNTSTIDTEKKGRDSDKNGDTKFWTSVPNFNQFKAKTPPMSFEQFESHILRGRSPFLQ